MNQYYLICVFTLCRSWEKKIQLWGRSLQMPGKTPFHFLLFPCPLSSICLHYLQMLRKAPFSFLTLKFADVYILKMMYIICQDIIDQAGMFLLLSPDLSVSSCFMRLLQRTLQRGEYICWSHKSFNLRGRCVEHTGWCSYMMYCGIYIHRYCCCPKLSAVGQKCCWNFRICWIHSYIKWGVLYYLNI